jgi:predicted  nucleic acid-binding Zn-ribbon protein
LRAKIPSQILAHYDRLVARGKKGLAAVRGQVCSGCHMQVPLGVVMTLKRGEDIQLCESCGRYLYLSPAVEKEATGPAASPKPERKKRKQKPPMQAV